jgi:hypothetical protein
VVKAYLEPKLPSPAVPKAASVAIPLSTVHVPTANGIETNKETTPLNPVAAASAVPPTPPLDDAPPLPAAYPIIQPIRVAEFFASAEGLGDWQVHLSGRAEQDLRTHRHSGKVFKIILKKIRCVSSLASLLWGICD